MKLIRKILTVRLQEPSASIRTISHSTGVSRPSVKEYLDRLVEHPLDLQVLTTMNDSELKHHLGIGTDSLQETPVNRQLIDWLTLNIGQLSRVGVTRRLLHEKYLDKYHDGLQYSQFCFVLTQHFQTPEVSAFLEHKAGDKLYIDFTGKKLHWTDGDGKEHVEEIFLAVMGASGKLFALPVPSQRQEDFVWAVQESFFFFGGVTKAIVPDCLKSAVIHNDGYEPIHNSLFLKLLDHFGTLSLPARPHHPKDKALVEGAVNLVYRQILARMHDQAFASREAMLLTWMELVKIINDKPFQKLPGSRQSRFVQIDQPALKPLPPFRFSITNILNQTVATAGVIYIPEDKTSYSVPFSLQGKKVEVLSFPDKVEIWHENERVASHQRQALAGKVISPEHRPPQHQWYANRDSTEMLRALTPSGIHVVSWSQKIVVTALHEDVAWKVLVGLSKIVHKFPSRIDIVCRIALKEERFTLRELKQILEREQDIQLIQAEELTPELLHHDQVRGAEYYCTKEA
jgi:transposase